MKFIIALLLLTTVLAKPLFAQISASKKVFISSGLEYLQLINDTTLWSSIDSDGDTTSYFIKADTLFIKDDYWRTRGNQTDYIVEWHDYKILRRSADTIFLLNRFRGYSKPSYWEDTLKFVNLEKLKEPITSFKFLRITYTNPFSGDRYILIDSSGKIIYQKGEIQPPTMMEVYTTLKGNFSKSEFKNFIDALSYCLPSKLRRFRGGCDAMDANHLTFEIKYNDKLIISRGCEMKWTHAFLFNYVYDLETNKGFVRQR